MKQFSATRPPLFVIAATVVVVAILISARDKVPGGLFSVAQNQNYQLAANEGDWCSGSGSDGECYGIPCGSACGEQCVCRRVCEGGTSWCCTYRGSVSCPQEPTPTPDVPQCSDGSDNDGDGATDIDDRGCHENANSSLPYMPNWDLEGSESSCVGNGSPIYTNLYVTVSGPSPSTRGWSMITTGPAGCNSAPTGGTGPGGPWTPQGNCTFELVPDDSACTGDLQSRGNKPPCITDVSLNMTCPAGTPGPTPTPTPTPTPSLVLNLTPSSTILGNNLTASWTYSSGTPLLNAWIALMPWTTGNSNPTWLNTTASANRKWLYSGNCSLTTGSTPANTGSCLFSTISPITAGQYEAAYYRNGGSADTDIIGRSTEVIVKSASVNVTVPSCAVSGSNINVQWQYTQGTPATGDWMAILPVGQTWLTGGTPPPCDTTKCPYWAFWNGTKATPGSAPSGTGSLPTFATNPAAGTYEVVYYNTSGIQNWFQVGRSNPITLSAGGCATPTPTPTPTPGPGINYVSQTLGTNANPTVGVAMSFNGTVRNAGLGGTSTSSTTRLRIDTNASTCSTYEVTGTNQTTTGLAAGATQVENWNSAWTPASVGTYCFQVCADSPTSAIAESNESDNCTTQTFGVAAVATPTPTPTPTPIPLSVTLSASPNPVTLSTSTTLTADVSGSSGTINYMVWWNCSSYSDSTPTMAEAIAACGGTEPSNPVLGTCTQNLVAGRCNSINTDPLDAPFTYTTTGSKTALVVVERGAGAAMDTVVVSVVSATPTPTPTLIPLSITLSASPNPVMVNSNTTLTADVSGGSGTMDYMLWWDCPTYTDSSPTLTEGSSACSGTEPSSPLAGNCVANTVAYRCNDINTDPLTYIGAYTSTGDKTVRVVVERNSVGAMDTTVVSVVSPTPTPTPNTNPVVSSVRVTEPNYCASGPAATVTWAYSDADGDPQANYQVQVDDTAAFTSPLVDQIVAGASTTHSVSSGILAFDTTYYARVRVDDTQGGVSAWTAMTLCTGPGCDATPPQTFWATPQFAYPSGIDFTWTPASPLVNQVTQFNGVANCPAGCATWRWNFGDGFSQNNPQNPTHTYTTQGNYTVTLQVTDAASHTCPGVPVSKLVGVQPPAPNWKEVSPQ